MHLDFATIMLANIISLLKITDRVQKKRSYRQKWFDLVGKQQKLRRILIINASMDFYLLQQLTLRIEKLPELEVIKLRWFRDNGYNEIVSIMATKTRLKNVVFISMEKECAMDCRK